MSESTNPIAAAAAGRQKRKTGVYAAIAAAVAGAVAGVGGHLVNRAAAAQPEQPAQVAVDVAVIKSRLETIQRDQGDMKTDLRELRQMLERGRR